MARQDGNAPILQLPGEVLFRIWSSLEEEHAGPSREAWRLVCSHFNNCVFKNCKRLAWRPQDSTHSGSTADSCLRALLHKFAAAGDGSGLVQLCLNGLQLQEEHCKALSEGVVRGKLRCLTTLQAAPDPPFGTAAQLTLGLLLSHCRQLTTFDIHGQHRQIAICSVCEMLQAVPAPVEPFRGLQVLRLQNWLFGTSQLTALRDALLNNLPTLTELNLGEWGVEESDRHINEGLLVDVAGAALASGNLAVLDLTPAKLLQKLQPEHHERLSQLLQSHCCTLTTLFLGKMVACPRRLASVLKHNQLLQSLRLTPVQSGDSDVGSTSGFTQLGAALGQLTRLTSLLGVFGQEGLGSLVDGLARHSALRRLSILGRPRNGVEPRLTAQNLQSLMAALRNMQQLRSLQLSRVVGASMLGACALMLSLSPQRLTALLLDSIAARSGMPAGDVKMLGSALQRLTSLQHLALHDLATDAGDAEHMSAAAAVAAALPHLPHLKEASIEIRGGPGGAGGLTVFGRRAAALRILSSACLVPSLRFLRLVGFLQGDDKVQAEEMVQRVMPHVIVRW